MADSDWHAEYYQRNKPEIAKKKRNRYQEDPEYREKVKAAAKERKRRLLEERKKAIAAGEIPARKKVKRKQKPYRVKVGAAEVEVVMYTAGQLAKFLDRKTQTIRLWEKRGILPKAMYRSNAGDRLYTEYQVRQLKSAYDKAIRIDGRAMVEERISSTSFSDMAHSIWKEYPLGIDLSET